MEKLKQAALKLSDALHNAELDGLEITDEMDNAWAELTAALIEIQYILG